MEHIKLDPIRNPKERLDRVYIMLDLPLPPGSPKRKTQVTGAGVNIMAAQPTHPPKDTPEIREV